jgi:hypothetical protein
MLHVDSRGAEREEGFLQAMHASRCRPRVALSMEGNESLLCSVHYGSALCFHVVSRHIPGVGEARWQSCFCSRTRGRRGRLLCLVSMLGTFV